VKFAKRNQDYTGVDLGVEKGKLATCLDLHMC